MAAAYVVNLVIDLESGLAQATRHHLGVVEAAVAVGQTGEY